MKLLVIIHGKGRTPMAVKQKNLGSGRLMMSHQTGICLFVFNKIPSLLLAYNQVLQQTISIIFPVRLLGAAPVSQTICATCCLTIVWTSWASSVFCKISRPPSLVCMIFALSVRPSWHQKVFLGQQVAGNRVKLCLVLLQLHLPHKKPNPCWLCKRPSFLKESFTNEFIHLNRNYSAELGTSFYLSFEPTSKAHNHSQSKHIPAWLPADEIADSVGMDEVTAWEKIAGLDP